MKKINNLSNSRLKEGQEKSKKIYRSISDLVKSLDDARSRACHIRDLFVPSIQIQRSKLQEYCERLIFNEPTTFGTKVEELLWRKTYYEVISTAKRLKKQEYSLEEKTNLIGHINAGIGHYHHYICRLQTEFEQNFEGDIDFFIVHQGITMKETPSKEIDEWCLTSVHKSLIYLGDLCRYKLEVYPNWDPNLAFRYYSHALLLKPDYGMPHNQMGTLASLLNQHLDSAYYYIQCMMSKYSFEGTENNLRRLLEKNAQYLEQIPMEQPDADCIIQLEQNEQVRRFIARFLLLADVWFFNKKIPHVYDLCHQTNIDLQECLSFLRPIASESSGSQNGDNFDTDSLASVGYLSGETMFKIIVICLQCVRKLQSDKNSVQLSNVIAFTLALYSQLVRHVSTHLQESILNCPVKETTTKKGKKRVQRRKKLPLLIGSDDESEGSEIELSDDDDDDEEDEEDENTDESEDEKSSSGEDEDDENDEETDEKNLQSNNENILPSTCNRDINKETLTKMKLLDGNVIVDIISEETYFESVKILSEWLASDVEVLKNCGKNTRSLFVQLVHLLNLINIDLRKIKDAQSIITSGAAVDKIPLDEDVLLKGLEVLSASQKSLDWNLCGRLNGLSKGEKVCVRIAKMLAFGRFLETHRETGVSYDNKAKQFCVEATQEDESNNGVSPQTTIEDFDDADGTTTTTTVNSCLVNNKANGGGGGGKPASDRGENKRELMKNMGQLWLAAEVRDLETRVKGKMSLSPYLVVDVDSLIKHMDMVKHLVHSRKFLILVPSAVLCALDDLKKAKSEAREAIRWLESQFRQGNRFFRPQRAQERLPIPYIKYPKKKDKDCLIYIQIIECCHYLAEQQKREGANLVTLLIGDPSALNNTESRKISYVGLAQSGGINLELITEFHAKWKKTAKGKR